MQNLSFPDPMAHQPPPWLVRSAIAASTLIALWSIAPVGIVPAGSRGVMTTLGKASDAGDAASKDLQQVRARVVVKSMQK